MNRRLLILFLCAILTAASIGYLVYRALGVKASPGAAAPMADIVVATRNLDVGELVSATDVKVAQWPGAALKGGMAKVDLAVNRGVVYPIYEGEPVLTERLAAPGSGAGLAGLIPPGLRACAVRVDDVVGVSGFVTPGMRVDVLMSGVPPGESGAGGPRVKTLMQNIRVLSAGINLQKDDAGKAQPAQVVNLLVTPEQAETLSLASGQTRIQLVLRNPVDTGLVTPRGIAMTELYGVPAPAMAMAAPAGTVIERKANTAPSTAVAAKPAQRAPRIVEVLNGTARTEARFNRAEEPQ
ncbi:MAG: Flp pilus assembly protein CpaB [Bryobacteraceae bacterium]